MSRRLTSGALLAMTLHAAGARAEGWTAPVFSFSGYGTAGIVHSSEKQADYTSSLTKPNGAGYSRSWSTDLDSRIGAQITANFTRQISGVLQIISEQRYDNSYTPAVEWANVKYQFTPDVSIRAGRIVLPVFLVSDYRKVGYANSWVRPPVEVYSLVPISNSDGVDASYRTHAGEFTNTVQVTYGNSEPRFPARGGNAKARNLWGISDTAEYGALTMHAAFYQTSLTFESFKPFSDALTQFGPEGIALAGKYFSDNQRFTFAGAGAMYDPGGWFVMGEWGAFVSHSVVGRRSAWYGSGGYRFGKITPYLIYARSKADSNTSDPGLTVSALPPFLAGPAGALNAVLNTGLESIPVQATVSAGGRWDFAKNAALKVQFDHTRIGAGSPGTLINVQPGFQPGGTFNVFSATLDFIF